MGSLPDYFRKVLTIAGVPEDQIIIKWQELWLAFYSQLLQWILTQMNLANDQLKELVEVMEQISSGKYSQDKNILDILTTILSSTQMDQVKKHSTEIIIEALDAYYTELKSHMNFEQLSLINSLPKAKYE